MNSLTPTQLEAIYPPDVIEAWHWVKQHCRHYATIGYDTQTTEYMSDDMQETSLCHLDILVMNDLVLLQDVSENDFYHKNFVVLNFGEKASTFYNRCGECGK